MDKLLNIIKGRGFNILKPFPLVGIFNVQAVKVLLIIFLFDVTNKQVNEITS